MANVYPMGDRLLVLPLKADEMTKGGIIMPETSDARERPQAGLVLAVGRGHVDHGVFVALEAEPGDVVQFGKYAGIYVYDGTIELDVLVMREDEALSRQLAHELDAEHIDHGGARHVRGTPGVGLAIPGNVW